MNRGSKNFLPSLPASTPPDCTMELAMGAAAVVPDCGIPFCSTFIAEFGGLWSSKIRPRYWSSRKLRKMPMNFETSSRIFLLQEIADGSTASKLRAFFYLQIRLAIRLPSLDSCLNYQVHVPKFVCKILCLGGEAISVCWVLGSAFNYFDVITADQVFEGDMVLCTVPLGVLKRRAVTIFGRLADNPPRRGEVFLFYSYAAVSGGPLLIALVAGEAAINFEKMPPLKAIQRVLSVLRAIYQPKGISVLDPMCVDDGVVILFVMDHILMLQLGHLEMITTSWQKV